MQINKIVIFFLVVSLCVMTLLSTLTTIDLSDQISETEKMLQENLSAREKNDELIQLLIEQVDENKRIENEKIAEKKRLEDVALANRNITNDYDVARPSGRTAEYFDKLLEGSGLAGLGKAIIAAEELYQINGIFIISVAQLESGRGTTYLARTKNNLFGLNAWGKTRAEINRRAYSYSTKGDCILGFSKIIRVNYIDKGRNTIKSIGAIYCEIPTYWCNKITILMEQNIKKLNEIKGDG